MVLTRLEEEGVLERVGWGLYRLAEAEPLGAPDLVLVSARVPRAVIGLVTALSHHGLTAEIPKEVRTGPYAETGVETFCDTLTAEAEPLENASLQAFGFAGNSVATAVPAFSPAITATIQ